MGANIFISFASQDRKVAMTLCSALESRGFKCWISARDIQPGENFQSAIVRAIRQAKIMLLVFTSNSNNSEEMNKELALASQSKLIVVPLRIEDVSPNDAFAYEFATRQWIDFFADWEFAIQQLAQRIAAATHEANATATVTEDPAPEADSSERAPKAAGEPPAEPEPPKPSAKPASPASAKAKPKVSPPAEIGEQTAARSRAPLYLALSAAAALALAAGLILPGALRHKAGPAGPRIMAAVHPAAPTGVQQVSIEVAPDPTLAPLPPAAANADAVPAEAAPAVDKPAPRKRKSAHPARTADNYVPY